jgi:4-diphosphocytidyl-2-C-methyl-D-erythritol kinase
MANPLPGVAPETDLTVRAANALRAATGVTPGVTIHLDKRLPMGGGLGGGSSDAATTLMALNQLWQTNLPSAELQRIGLQLGADVPVFIHGRTTFAEGIGERFTDVEVPPANYLVLMPPVAVPTPLIFHSPELRRDTPVIPPALWQSGMGGNDLQPVACQLFPEVAKALDYLRRFGDARMSGSGACCFVEFPDLHAANAALERRPQGMQGFVAQGLDRHPLCTASDN